MKNGTEKVLVTGATGFLGGYLVRRLVGEYCVLAMGRNVEKGKQLEELGAIFCPGDFTDRKSCEKFFQGVSYVVHAGALSSVWGNWEDFYRANVLGTEIVAKMCRKYGVKRLVFISSPSVYSGMQDRYRIREGQAPEKNELNYYIKSKLMAEHALLRGLWANPVLCGSTEGRLSEGRQEIAGQETAGQEMPRREAVGQEMPGRETVGQEMPGREAVGQRGEKGQNLEIVILRPRGLIGIGDTSLVPRLLRANSSIGIPLFREGKNLVDMTSVENVALACRLAMTAEGAAGQVFNITNGEPAEFKQLLEQFLEAAGETPHYRKLPFAAMYAAAAALEGMYRVFRLSGEPPLTRYTVCTLGFSQTMDISRAEKILGYHPEKKLEESIREYGEWWKNEKGRNAGKGRNVEISKSVEKGWNAERGRNAGKGRNAKNSWDTEESRIKTGKSQFAKPSAIAEVRLYHCGYCTNNLAVMFRGQPWERRRFPAMAALIRHKELGDILYDTGYSERIFQKGMILKLYRLLNPVCLDAGQTIAARLTKDGIRTGDIKHIILSHAHPDHIGGLSDCKGGAPCFADYELTASGEVLEDIKTPSLRNLAFSGLMPYTECISRMHVPEKELTDHFLCTYFDKVYDLFGDGSIIGVGLDGHCKGQLGVWIPDMSLLLGADACWGRDLISATPHMRLIPRLVQNDYDAYKDTLRRICRLRREHPEIHIVFSHDRGREKRYG